MKSYLRFIASILIVVVVFVVLNVCVFWGKLILKLISQLLLMIEKILNEKSHKIGWTNIVGAKLSIFIPIP